MALHVIYVPGLGDERPYGQKDIIRSWRIFGLHAHYLALGWAKAEGFETKLQRLLDKIDHLKTAGNDVALVGVSAGASAVINAYAQRPKKIRGVVCIVGKIQNPQTVHPRRFAHDPDFKASLYIVQDSLTKLGAHGRKKIMSIHPIYDQTVPVADTIIPGAVEKLVRTRGHIFTIFYTIIFRSRLIARFFKQSV